MKSKILLFSTRDIGIKGTLFENITSEVCSVLCRFFMKTNYKELNIIKQELLPKSKAITAKTTPSKDEIYNKIDECYEGNVPSEINEAYSYGTDALITKTKELLDVTPNEELFQFLNTIKSGISPFEEIDFSNETYLNASAFNINKNGKTIRDRVSIFKTPVFIGPDESGANCKYQIFAVWPLSEAVSDESWEKALVESVVELELKTSIVENIDELEISLFLHDKDLTRTYNTPFKTEYIRKPYDAVKEIQITYSFTSFTHSDFEYINIRNNKDVPRPILFSHLETLTKENVIYQLLLDISDQLANWHNNNQKESIFSNLIDFINEIEWHKKRWDKLRIVTDQILKWKSLTGEERTQALLMLNSEINKMIRSLRKRNKDEQ